MRITPRAQRYTNWMAALNEIGKAHGRIYLRNKFTWRAFCQGQTPEQYVKSLGGESNAS